MHFDAVNAKLRAMHGALFKYDDYEALCRMDTVAEIGTRLRETPSFRQTLAGLDGVELRRNLLEHKITLSLYYDYARIRLYFYEKSMQDYLAALFMQYELNITKLLLCMVFDERNIPYSLPELNILFGHLPGVDLAKLAVSKTVPEFIEHLRGTPFYHALADTYTTQPSLFALERQLDLFYYLQLWKKQDKLLDKQNCAVMRRIKGTEIDLRNIMWIYRLKHYYRVSDARIYAYLIPINYLLPTESVNRMAEAESIDTLLEEVASGPYRNVFVNFNQPEHAFIRAMRRVYRDECRKHPDSIAAVASYIFDREQEINNITTAMEGVRYELSPAEILSYLCI